MVKIFWLLFWANIGFLILLTLTLIGFIWCFFFSKRELSDEDRRELEKLLKGGKHDN